MPSERKIIGLRDVRSLGPGETIWDARVSGFGARRQKGPGVSYILFYRTKDGRQRWATIGRHGSPWTPDTARDEARRLLAEVVAGQDPSGLKQAAQAAPTVADLCDQYWTAAEAGRLLTRRRLPKTAATLTSDKGRIERHIRPLLGTLKVAAVTRADVEKFMHAVAEGETAGRTRTEKVRGLANVRGGQGAATRTVGLLGAMFTFAVRQGMRSDNPVHGVLRFADGRRERRLSADEYKALGKALDAAESASVWPSAISAARFLLLTGWRMGEALSLKRAEIDLERRTAILSDTKTGRSLRPLSQAACDVLRDQRSAGELVFPPSRGDGLMTGFPKLFRKIAELGKIPKDVTPHVLRHSFASLASDLGYSEPTIAALIGHKGHSVTSRYTHSADAVLLAAADRIGKEILARTESRE